MSNKKKILIISLVIITLLGLTALVLFIRSSKPVSKGLGTPSRQKGITGLPGIGSRKKGAGVVSPGKEASPKLPQAPNLESAPSRIAAEEIATDIASGGLVKTYALNKDNSRGVTLSGDGRTLSYYNQDDGKFYRIDNNGKKTLLSDKVFHNVQKINWAPNSEKTILEYPDGANIYYNFKTQKQVTLPSHWQEFDFSADSKKIGFKSYTMNPEDNWMAIANPDGTQAEALRNLGQHGKNLQISLSPNNQIIGTVAKSIDLNRQDVFFIGKNHENFRSMVIEGRGFKYKWFPKGKKMLYSVFNQRSHYLPTLWIVDSQGDNIGANRQQIPVNTWADRCTITKSGAYVYCARPKEKIKFMGMLPYLLDEQNIPSEIIKINTTTGKVTTVGEPEIKTNITNLKIDQNEEYVYFQDTRDQTIKQIRLK